jgi:palmitoyl-protein thioesterase
MVPNHIMLASTFSYIALFLVTAASPSSPPRTQIDDDHTPLPLIIWHGLGDTFNGDGIKWTGELAQSVHEGTFVYPISLAASDASADRSATFWGNVTEQLDTVCQELAAHPILSTAPAVDALGFSQGGIFLRGFVERCNFPKVRSLVTFGTPHNGIIDFKACGPTDWLCKGAMALLKSNTWSSYVQNRLVPAQYYRTTDPKDSSKASEEYLEHSNFLADINNERSVKNGTYAANIATLHYFVAYIFENDTTVVPSNSAWFDDVDLDSGKITALKDRAIYKEDWLGLKKLNEKGGLLFKSTPGEHMQLDEEVLLDAFKLYFGPLKEKASSSESSQMERYFNVEL